MIGSVIDGDENRSQIRLSRSLRNLRREVELAVVREALESHPIFLPSRDALVPRLVPGGRRVGWPIVVGPFEFFLVLRILHEVEQIVLSDSNVLEQLPRRVGESGRPFAPKLGR